MLKGISLCCSKVKYTLVLINIQIPSLVQFKEIKNEFDIYYSDPFFYQFQK